MKRDLKLFLIVLWLTSNLIGDLSFAREVLKSSPSPAPKIIIVDPPQDLETCFSPDMPCNEKLVQFILSTKCSLDIAIYDLTDKNIANAIVKIAEAKISPCLVRIVVDQIQSIKLYSQISYLKSKGIAIKSGKQNKLMHNKFMIQDGKMLETGSFNYSVNASKFNQENQVYLAHPTIVSAYKKRFESMWEKANPWTAPKKTKPL